MRLPFGLAKLANLTKPGLTVEQRAVVDALGSTSGVHPLADAALAEVTLKPYTQPHSRREFFQKTLELPHRAKQIRALKAEHELNVEGESSLREYGPMDPPDWRDFDGDEFSQLPLEIQESLNADKLRGELVRAGQSPLDAISHEQYWGGLVDDPNIMNTFNELDVVKNPPPEVVPEPQIEGPNRAEEFKKKLGRRFGRGNR